MEWFEFSWWAWMLLGVALATLELLTPGGFYVIFFGIGAGVVGLLDLFGVSLGLPEQGLLFLTVSLVALALFRKPLLQRMEAQTPKHKVDELPGETAHALEDIPAQAFGKTELRGAAWTSQNIGDSTIPRAGRCTVVRVEGLTLLVRGAPQP